MILASQFNNHFIIWIKQLWKTDKQGKLNPTYARNFKQLINKRSKQCTRCLNSNTNLCTTPFFQYSTVSKKMRYYQLCSTIGLRVSTYKIESSRSFQKLWLSRENSSSKRWERRSPIWSFRMKSWLVSLEGWRNLLIVWKKISILRDWDFSRLKTMLIRS